MPTPCIEPDCLRSLLGPLGPAERVIALHGDGSSRRFFRVYARGESFVLLEGPDPLENAAYVRIARHLADRGVRVPRVYGWEEQRGWILLEDLGDRSLFSAAREASDDEAVLRLYGPVLDLLVRMQIQGSEGFALSTGFAPAPYGRELMVEGEGMYFVREFAMGVLGMECPAGVRSDFERLAAEASEAPSGYFLHRDFQSRNVQLTPKGPALIDFQGARPGPSAYDAAALILDPYPALSVGLRHRLFEAYLDRRRAAGTEDEETLRGSWYPLGAFRLLQALGAFGKLGGRLGKPGFLEHAGKALDILADHLGDRGRVDYPRFWRLVSEACERWGERGRGEAR